jgi:hypothetical protein
MTNEEFVRQAYAIAEVKDIAGWIACFNPDGVFVDESIGVTYRGPDEVAKPVENYGTRPRATGCCTFAGILASDAVTNAMFHTREVAGSKPAAPISKSVISRQFVGSSPVKRASERVGSSGT